MTGSKRDEIRKYYKTAWQKVFDEMSCRLRGYGFEPKGKNGKYEIGNEHGEVYAYPAETSKLYGSVQYVLIMPTNTGKLSIKLAFRNRVDYLGVAERIKTTIKPKAMGTPSLNKDGYFVAEYLFYPETRPVNPLDASDILQEIAVTWLKVITEER